MPRLSKARQLVVGHVGMAALYATVEALYR